MGTATRLTTRHQSTIPVEVRRALDLSAGDQVEFAVEGGTVTLRKARPLLSEWALHRAHRACFGAMITIARNLRDMRAGDIEIADLGSRTVAALRDPPRLPRDLRVERPGPAHRHARRARTANRVGTAEAMVRCLVRTV